MSNVMKVVGSSAHTSEEREENDFYATDPQAMVDFLEKFHEDGESFAESIWEPACGEGNLSKELELRGHGVLSTDLINRGYGSQLDFLQVRDTLVFCGDILTNPPYKFAEQFVQMSLRRVQDGSKVAMLFKLQFVESAKRLELFQKSPPKFIYVHSRRIQIWKNNKRSSGNALCYAWFVWEKGYKGETTLRWIP